MSLRRLGTLSWCSLVFGIAAVTLFTVVATLPATQAAPRLISRDQARHLGLERAWFSQVRLDRSRNQVERAVLKGERLTVLTTAGVVHEFNANTGATMWIAPIGNPNYPSLGPAASDQHVALINGSTLYVLDRADGRPIIVRPVSGAPGASPALAKEHVFVPLINGRIEGYPLGEQTITPWFFQSYGRAMVPPLATPKSIVWSTDAGHVYVGDSQKLGVRFRLETGGDIAAPPAYRDPYIYAATMSGELFAVHELSGERQWKYAAGFLVTRAPAAVGERIFITTDEPALHCVDATNGRLLWETPKVTQFAAVSRNRVYGVDDLGALVVLDAASGALVERMPTEGTDALVNDHTDRLFLISRDGVVQCLHEIGASQPLYHNPPVKEDEPVEPGAEATSEPAATESREPESETPPAAADDEDPFSEMDEAGAAEEDEEAPADEGEFGVEGGNPFEE